MYLIIVLMEREIIRSMVDTLPTSELGKIAEDNEIWEETDGLAHFKVTRHELDAGSGLSFTCLTVSGIAAEKDRVISEFTEVFGKPTDRGVIPNTEIDMVAWLSKED
jgi:hypothetical protein